MRRTLACASLILLAACSGGPPSPGPGSARRKIAGIVFQEAQFFRSVELGMRQAAEKAVAEVSGGRGRKAREAHTKDVIKVWCTLHGMVSLCNSNIVGYGAEDTQAIYDQILGELIDSVLS